MSTAGLIISVPALTGAGIGIWIVQRRSRGAQAGTADSGKRRVSIRRRVLGIILGIAAGLLVDALLVLQYRLPILYFVVFSLGLVVILPLAVGIVLGLLFARSDLSRDLPWPVLILLAVVLWPAVVAAPFGARMLQMRTIARADIPVYPGAELGGTSAELGDGENTGDRVRLTFHAAADSSSILTFYRDELARRGWEAEAQHFIETRHKGTSHCFINKTKFASIHIRFMQLNRDGTLSYEINYGL